MSEEKNVKTTSTARHSKGRGKKKVETDVPVENGDAGTVKVPKAHAVVRYAAGRTINVGNFESIRVDVGVEVPCKLDFDAIDSSYEWARGWADERLNDVTKEVEEAIS